MVEKTYCNPKSTKMYEYKVLTGIAAPELDGIPKYIFQVNGNKKKQEDLSSVINRMARNGWEPWHLALPTTYPVYRNYIRNAPVTIIFRRKCEHKK